MLPALLVPAILSPELFSFREITIILAWIPVFTVPAVFIKNEVFNKAVLLLLFLESFLNLFHWLLLKSPLTATSIFVVANTNYYEASEFLQFKSGLRLLLLVPYVLYFIFLLRKKSVFFPEKIFKITAFAVLSASMIFLAENAINGSLVRLATPQSARAVITYFNETGVNRAVTKRKAFTVKTSVRDDLKNKEQVCVLVIGESANRNHLSLYGYHRNTCPRLETRNDIIVFTDVISPWSNTLFSVTSMLTESNIENNKPINESISLAEIFRSTGFSTYWISNQPPAGLWDNTVSELAGLSDKVKFVNISSNTSFESTYTPSFDNKVFEPLEEALNDTFSKKFIVIHLMGSHTSYSKRSPGNFKIYRSHNTYKEKVINEYDNSVVYTDFIVDSIINILSYYSSSSVKRQAVMIYLSDHGENVFDDAGSSGHDYTGQMPRSICEIPFIVWYSEEYGRLCGDVVKSIKMNTCKPYSSDGLFHTVLDACGVECEYFDRQRSIFNEDFTETRPRKTESGGFYEK